MTDLPALYHGGVPGLRPGQFIEPGHNRKSHPGCLWCEARAAGLAGPGGIDAPSLLTDAVYATTVRLYAKFHASLYGRGDLYRVVPDGPVTASTEDTIPTVTAPRMRVVNLHDRAVLLTDRERRALWRLWTQCDAAAYPREERAWA